MHIEHVKESLSESWCSFGRRSNCRVSQSLAAARMVSKQQVLVRFAGAATAINQHAGKYKCLYRLQQKAKLGFVYVHGSRVHGFKPARVPSLTASDHAENYTLMHLL
jgi:hypothetical protein